MKALLSFFAMILIMVPVSFAENQIPNLVGKWEVKVSALHTEKWGHKTAEALSDKTFEIISQENRNINGKKTWIHSEKKEEMEENFSGVIGYFGKKVYIAEHDDGYLFGDIISDKKIVLYYLESGEHAKAITWEMEKTGTTDKK